MGPQAAFSIAEAGARALVFAGVGENTAQIAAEEAKRYATNPNFESVHFVVNIRDERSVVGMVDFVVDRFGRIDYAVNASGKDQNVWKPIAETDVATYDRIMEINARGMLLCCKAEAAVLRKQSPKTFTGRNGTRDIGRGAIVNIASANAFVGLPGKVSYAMSKHAAMGLIKMVGLDHAPEGVRCNVICPTWVRTAVLEEELAASPEYKAMITSLVPIKRAAEGEELADKIAYLLSPSASYINGASVLLDAAATTTARLF